MIPPEVQRYLDSRGLVNPWRVEGIERENFDAAVVIPALAEGNQLFRALASLAGNPGDALDRILVLVVVNQRGDTPAADRKDNEFTLRRLAGGFPGLHLARVDGCSPGKELPAKGGGVGMARKIGFDLTLPKLRFQDHSPLLISLDADTLVRPDYLPALFRHFASVAAPGAVIPFCHQPGATVEEEKAVQRYELFLRAYVLGLARAGSPYAFHTVGSAMACTAQGYVRMGGMNTRMAAEDFYFLQQLARTGGVARVKDTVVYPSARPSHRVPFGTGRSIGRLLAGEKGVVLFHRKESFQVLEEWLNLVEHNLSAGGEDLRGRAGRVSLHLAAFLDLNQFVTTWGKLQRNFRAPAALLASFHGWFDGLKTMKLIHHLAAGPFPKGEPEETVPGLLEWAGHPQVTALSEQLSLLREVQIDGDY